MHRAALTHWHFDFLNECSTTKPSRLHKIGGFYAKRHNSKPKLHIPTCTLGVLAFRPGDGDLVLVKSLISCWQPCKFLTGSQESSLGPNPFHLIKYSTFPCLVLLPSMLSTCKQTRTEWNTPFNVIFNQQTIMWQFHVLWLRSHGWGLIHTKVQIQCNGKL